MSLLTDLPPELFEHVLRYLLNAEAVGRVTDHSARGYRFDLSIFRVNKQLPEISKHYFENANTWLHFVINISAFSPVHFDVPYYTAKTANDVMPPTPLHVKIRFPEPILGRSSTIYRDDDMTSVYVLARDFNQFQRYIRLHDFSMCVRVQPGDQVRDQIARKGEGGVSYKIRVESGVTAPKTRPLLELFRDMHGPLHQCVILNAPDVIFANSIIASIYNEPGNGQNPNVEEEARRPALLQRTLRIDNDSVRRRAAAESSDPTASGCEAITSIARNDILVGDEKRVDIRPFV